jgi:hypothetical protein
MVDNTHDREGESSDHARSAMYSPAMQNRDVRALMAAHGHSISPWTLRRISIEQLHYTITPGGKTGKGHRRYSEMDVLRYLKSRGVRVELPVVPLASGCEPRSA